MWLILLVLVAAVLAMTFGRKTLEGWQVYQQKPFQWMDTGADPMYYYPMKQFRLPYRWPLTFYQSYPYPHMANFDSVMGAG